MQRDLLPYLKANASLLKAYQTLSQHELGLEASLALSLVLTTDAQFPESWNQEATEAVRQLVDLASKYPYRSDLQRERISTLIEEALTSTRAATEGNAARGNE